VTRIEYCLNIVPGTTEVQNRTDIAKKFKSSISFLLVLSDRLLGVAIIWVGLAYCRITNLKELWQWVGYLTYGIGGIQPHYQSINNIKVAFKSVILYIFSAFLINLLNIKEVFLYRIYEYVVLFFWELFLKRLWTLKGLQVRKKATTELQTVNIIYSLPTHPYCLRSDRFQKEDKKWTTTNRQQSRSTYPLAILSSTGKENILLICLMCSRIHLCGPLKLVPADGDNMGNISQHGTEVWIAFMSLSSETSVFISTPFNMCINWIVMYSDCRFICFDATTARRTYEFCATGGDPNLAFL
jgi:hypothetical protein